QSCAGWFHTIGIVCHENRIGSDLDLETQPAIDVAGLNFTYPDGKRALGDLSFQIAAGETVGLVGPNGAGKTTLFLCLAGVLAAQTGSVRVAGLDPRQPAERQQLPARVGI